MADNILRIGAEFDVSQIVAGTQEASAAFDGLGSKVGEASAKMLNELYPAEQAAGVAAQEEAISTESLGAASASVAPSLEAEAAASDRAAAGSRSHAEANIQARLTTDLLTGNVARAENALIRFAARSATLGPLIQAAFAPFAIIVFAEILEHAYEAIQKVTAALVGNTEAVQQAAKEEKKFAEEALGHAQSLEEAHRKLGEVLQREGDIAQQTYGEKFASAAKKAQESTSAFLEIVPGLRGLVVGYEALAHAESDAADQAEIFGKAQRSLIVDTMEQEISLNREAVKLIGDKVSAENAGLRGPDSRVQEIKNEIAALKDKQAAEEKIADREAEITAIRRGTDPSKARSEAKTNVDEEFYLKRIELTNKLGAAEQEEADKAAKLEEERLRHLNDTAESMRKVFPELAEAQKKILLGGQSEESFKATAGPNQLSQLTKLNSEISAAQTERIIKMREEQKVILETAEMFSKSESKIAEETIKTAEETAKAQAKNTQEVNKLAEESSLKQIGYEESTVKTTAETQKLALAGLNTTALQRIKIESEINAQELLDMRKLEEEKIRIQMEYLEEQKRILLGGETEQSFVVNASPEQLSALQKMNSEIAASKAELVNQDEQYNEKMLQNNIRTADQIQAAYEKAFQPINRAFDQMVTGVIQGTQTLSQVFARTASNLVTSMANALAQMLLKHIETELAIELVHLSGTTKQTATTVAGQASQTAAVSAGQAAQTAAVSAGSASRTSVGLIADIKSIGEAAATAAAHAFKWVMVEVPFPANVALAPAAAAAAFTGVLAFKALASAEFGGEIPGRHGEAVPMIGHGKELVLPERIATPLQGVIPAMQKFNMNMNSQSSSSSAAGATTTNSVSRGDTHITINHNGTNMTHEDIIRAVKIGVRKGQLSTGIA